MASKSEIDASQSFNDSHWQMYSVSISMPSSPSRIHLESSKREHPKQEGRNVNNGIPNPPTTSIAASSEHPKHARFYCQPIPASTSYVGAAISGESLNLVENEQKNPRIDRLKDRHYDSFKTFSGKLEKKLSRLHGKHWEPEPEPEVNFSQNAEIQALPVDRYFAALEGPELDTLRASEESVLPEDKKWPFLLRYPISSFGICLGVSSQAILWKTLATSKSMSFLHISLTVNLVLWCISAALMVTVFFIYSLKVIFYFEAVRREYYHPIRVNFFFAPWIASLFLVLGVPPLVAKSLHAVFWYILMTPIICLELKIYGQWMSGGQRRLSKVANPSNHLSIAGNFVGALLGASMGLKEGPIFFFAVGLAHYMVLFVTLYQRLPTNETLPKELHPMFFLFVAGPNVASMAWTQIQGEFDYGSRIAYFIGLFLYFSLVVRINFFRGFRFSLAWWAYTFPMTGASIATIRYSNEVTNIVTQILSVVLSGISIITAIALLIVTILHAFVLRDLFPNDIAIAISDKRSKTGKKRSLRSGSSDTKDIEASLKQETSAG
ncbi:S-type anion channel SLAH2-like [Telopea speciosissima]|uniref:S-type anion channel SLAH2-like n=1 Tax=Telopea speciosissima TaxID=54955 RepID=UPI001CC520CE|nr:S-type anion channel SLAH2-like [Telopea speciosissima]XP_043720985.1 S-type anion channel SLAH2-like [Telopea speciosissima]